MRKRILSSCLGCVLFAGIGVTPVLAQRLLSVNRVGVVRHENQPRAEIPGFAREMVLRADDLAAHDRADEAVEGLQRAIALAPNYVNAHAKYIEIKGKFLVRYDEAREEYYALMRKEPDNPVYPLALAIAHYNSFPSSRNALLQKVVQIAPDWVWSHYARALLTSEKEPENAEKELLQYLAEDGSYDSAYYLLIYLQEKKLNRMNDAIATAQRMAARTELRPDAFYKLWSLRLENEHGSTVARAKLKNELDDLVRMTTDIKTLISARNAYEALLNDQESVKVAEARIKQLDPAWDPFQGFTLFLGNTNMSGARRLIIITNHQVEIISRSNAVNDPSDPKGRITHLEGLLALNPNADVKRYLYEQIFMAAEKAKDNTVLVKYGERLMAIDDTDTAVPARIAIMLSKNKLNASRALHYARIAENATAVFRSVPRSANNGMTDEEWSEFFPEKAQRELYATNRALALEALGLANSALGRTADAETELRQAVALYRSEQVLSALAVLLDQLGRKSEAREMEAAAKVQFVEGLKKNFTNSPAKDFELKPLDGQLIRLSQLQGKVVMLIFWATWCGPCRVETPYLVSLYQKYHSKGLEILYVSVDGKSDQYKLAPFVVEQKINYPVLLDDGVKDLYGVRSFPATIFIDRLGKVRHREVGFLKDETPRIVEAVVAELLGSSSPN